MIVLGSLDLSKVCYMIALDLTMFQFRSDEYVTDDDGLEKMIS